jgi:hypothetical protein
MVRGHWVVISRSCYKIALDWMQKLDSNAEELNTALSLATHVPIQTLFFHSMNDRERVRLMHVLDIQIMQITIARFCAYNSPPLLLICPFHPWPAIAKAVE